MARFKFVGKCLGTVFLYVFSIKKPYTEPDHDESTSWDLVQQIIVEQG